MSSVPSSTGLPHLHPLQLTGYSNSVTPGTLISQTLVNTGFNVDSVTYHITPESSGCPGSVTDYQCCRFPNSRCLLYSQRGNRLRGTGQRVIPSIACSRNNLFLDGNGFIAQPVRLFRQQWEYDRADDLQFRFNC